MKHRLARAVVIFLFFALILPFISLKVYAGSLVNTSLRLDTQSANSATGGMVCAQTPSSSNGLVAKVAVTFPTGFTLNSTASNWTVDTSNLPSGATAWPGIDTATSVSGRSVTFPSSNLATDTYYCFNFSGSNTLTTGSSGNDLTGTIETLASNNSTIDYKTYAVSVISSSGITVTATSPQNPDDFSVKLAANPPNATLSQNTTIKYTLSYKSNLSYAADMKVEAEWSLGTISGDTTPTIEVLDYVSGSATNAYNSTPPVVDIVNHKIDWTISGVPANTPENSVYFLLSTNSSYKGQNSVSFNVAARIIGLGNVATPDSIITQNYQYGFTAPVTNNTTPTPTPTPALSESSSPEKKLTFSGINISTITYKTAEIEIVTNKPANATLSYGTSIKTLTKSASDSSFSTYHLVSIGSLSSQTTYFFRVTSTGQDSSTITSDIYTFKTATSSEPPEVNLSTIIISSNDNILLSTAQSKDQAASPSAANNLVVLPQNSTFRFSFSLVDFVSVKRIKAFVRNKYVIGVTSSGPQTDVSSQNVNLMEAGPGVYAGLLKGADFGVYELYIQIHDYKGNIAEQKIASISFVNPFIVLNPQGKPIENARVVLSLYNPYTKLYSVISETALNLKNPSFTNPQGIISYVLPAGQYSADVSSIGFKNKKVKFSIGASEGNYPKVILESEPFGFLSAPIYYWSIISDVFHEVQSFIGGLTTSARVFDLTAALALTLLVITTLFALSVRTHIPFELMPVFFIFHFKEILGLKHPDHAFGRVIDSEAGHGITRAQIELFDNKTGDLISRSLTNRLGEFIIRRREAKSYKIVIRAAGFHSLTVADYPHNALSLKLRFTLDKKGEELNPTWREILASGVETLLGFSFMFLLLNCLAFELIFIHTISLLETLPFLLVTIFTIITWLFYARRVVRKNLSPTR